jgi:hypothetical protein
MLGTERGGAHGMNRIGSVTYLNFDLVVNAPASHTPSRPCFVLAFSTRLRASQAPASSLHPAIIGYS